LDERRERARRCFAPAQPGGGGRDAESELRSGAEPDMFGDRVVQRQVQRPFETEERRHPREDAGGTFLRLARLVKDAAPKRQARADAVDREPDAAEPPSEAAVEVEKAEMQPCRRIDLDRLRSALLPVRRL